MNHLLTQLKIPLEEKTKTVTETSIKNNQTKKNLNENVTKLMNDNGTIDEW